MCVPPVSCCLLGTHYWGVYRIVSQPRWQLEGQGRVSGSDVRHEVQGKGESTEGRAPTLNLLGSHTADGGSDQLAFLVFTSTPKLWTGRPQGVAPWSPGRSSFTHHLSLACPGPYQCGQLLYIVHGLQSPCQPCEGGLLLGFSLLRAAGTT